MTTKIDYSATGLGDPRLDTEYETELQKCRAVDAEPERNLINGNWESSDEIVERIDPVEGKVRAGAAFIATDDQISRAIAAAKGVALSWRRTPYQDRNQMLAKVRDDYEEQLPAMAAVISAETGKTRLEAFGEAQEVLDMIDHYAELFAKNKGYVAQQKSSENETNWDILVPYGVFAVISPFNFPAALVVGMSTAALVTGNTIVLKPSDKTPRSTALVAETFARHLPRGVVNVVHGGGDVGQKLVEGDVDGIAFTGSVEVGWKLVSAVGPRGYPRPVLAEMGGQNPAIVAESADIEAAASGIARSAFGLSGQKCSACRRVIVHEDVAGELIAAIKQKAEALVVGDPIASRTDLGPVIDDAIAARIDAALTQAQQDGSIVTGGKSTEHDGNFYDPIVVTDLPRGHSLTRTELFAPFLTITLVESFEEALAEANAVDYGLSAGVYSRDQDELDLFYDTIEAGVVYSNRPQGATTGAWPGVQSFCGWKRSGTTGKGGLGLHYLQGFMREQNRTIASF
ncbi:MAG: aldehyde dehydrogenase family protein [Micrococcaceae bacterium]|nr:aldehyde dehydrogenase family protein [Micrococcaceae bacterium]